MALQSLEDVIRDIAVDVHFQLRENGIDDIRVLLQAFRVADYSSCNRVTRDQFVEALLACRVKLSGEVRRRSM